MLGHGGSSAGSYLADPTSPISLALCCHYPVSKCRSASIVVTSTVRVNLFSLISSPHLKPDCFHPLDQTVIKDSWMFHFDLLWQIWKDLVMTGMACSLDALQFSPYFHTKSWIIFSYMSQHRVKLQASSFILKGFSRSFMWIRFTEVCSRTRMALWLLISLLQ